MAFASDDSPTLNAFLVALRLFTGSGQVLLRNPIALWFFRGGGGGSSAHDLDLWNCLPITCWHSFGWGINFWLRTLVWRYDYVFVTSGMTPFKTCAVTPLHLFDFIDFVNYLSKFDKYIKCWNQFPTGTYLLSRNRPSFENSLSLIFTHYYFNDFYRRH